MAKEQKVQIKYQTDLGKFTYRWPLGQQQYNQATGTGGTPGVVNATTAAAAVSFTPVVPGYVIVHNLSTSDTVHFQTTAGGRFATFTPNKQGLIPRSTACGTWQVAASTAGGTANVEILGFST